MLLLLLACSDDKATATDTASTEPVGTADIWYYPDALSFSPALLGSGETKQVSLRNLGDADLTIRSIAPFGSSAFTVSAPDVPLVLTPGEISFIDVAFSPINPNDVGGISIFSNDLDSPRLDVTLEGFALEPAVALTPNPVEYGYVKTGCKVSHNLLLENVGYAELSVEDIVVTSGAFEITNLDLPLVRPIEIAAGSSLDLEVEFSPNFSLDFAQGEVWFTANDILGVNVAILNGKGTEETTGQDEFWQTDAQSLRADIVMFSSRANTMSDNRANTDANLDFLADSLSRSPVDWRLGVVTGDDGCVNTGVFDAATFAGGAVFDSVNSGPSGDLADEGLTVLTHALEQAGTDLCNAGLLRQSSRPVLVVIADGPDVSANSWTNELIAIQELAPSAIIYTVTPAEANGCETTSLGTGYTDAATATGGATIDFCGEKWGESLGLLIDQLYTGPTNTFPLSSLPDPDSITVTVDGAPTTAWTWNIEDNTLIFTTAPIAGAHIVVDYDLGGSCE